MHTNAKYIRTECWILVLRRYRLISPGHDKVTNKYAHTDPVIFNMKTVKWI